MARGGFSLGACLLLGGLFSACSNAGTTSAYTVDQSAPAQVLQAVFDIAGGAEPKALAGLCDPLHQNDLDTQRICDQAKGVDPLGSFALYFGKGRLTGEAKEVGDSAWLPFAYGPDGDHHDTLCLIRRDGLWYLLNFGDDADDAAL
jgi:hypothetical protein